MNDVVKCGVCLIAGAVTGFLVAKQMLKQEYEKILDEEIEKTKQFYAAKHPDKNAKKTEERPVKRKAPVKHESANLAPIMDRNEYTRIVEDCGYKDYSASATSEKCEDDNIEHITPEDFGQNDYDIIELRFCPSNQKLVDDGGYDVDNFKERIGSDFCSYIGVYEDEVGYFRNHAMRTDYSVTLDETLFNPLEE